MTSVFYSQEKSAPGNLSFSCYANIYIKNRPKLLHFTVHFSCDMSWINFLKLKLVWCVVISIALKLQSNLIEITVWHGCSPVSLCTFSEHLFITTCLEGCFWKFSISESFSIWKPINSHNRRVARNFWGPGRFCKLEHKFITVLRD